MILIVEDEAISRRALQHLLRLNGYSSQAAGSAEEALRMTAEGLVADVALVDVNLPGMDGVEMVRELQRRNPSVRPVYMTACERDDLPAGCETQSMRYLRKPLQVAALLDVIASATLA